MKKILLLVAVTAVVMSYAGNPLWKKFDESTLRKDLKRQIIPDKYAAFELDVNALKNILLGVPNEKDVNLRNGSVLELPSPDGVMQQFKVVESPIMEKPLADAFPEIKTYSIKGITDPYASGKIDINEFGFHGMIRSVNGDFFIDPYGVQDNEHYIVYYTKDFSKPLEYRLPEASMIDEHNENATGSSYLKSMIAPPAPCVGANLKTYRLAVACTGEYAVAATGLPSPSIAQTLAKIVTSINRVDGVYETEVAVRLVLVATETNVIYTNASTDPFNGNNNASVLIGESQSEISSTIGNANFDIGHTFSTGGGGLAGFGVVCNNSQKASGITGSPSPVGDPYDIDYVSHEIGHQFGGSHTFNSTSGSCGGGNRSSGTAVEPGSGVTIMGYAGICGTNNITSNSIAYFHAVSYDQIVNFVTTGGGNACDVQTASGNQAPVVNAVANYIIPANTPFTLTGSATDPDSDPITYSWEETDLGTAGNWNSGNKPFFRSYDPVTTGTRNFPILSSVLSNNYQGLKGEYLPTTTQNLSFRLTVRDNQMGGGGVCFTTSSVSVNSTVGPFEITYPNSTGIAWGMGDQQNVSWDVNNTNFGPVNCASVNILISYNSGNTFTMLAAGVPNSGLAQITVPTLSANVTTCRIKVESVENIFYDINSPNFTIATTVAGINEIPQGNAHVIRIYPNPSSGTIKLISKNLNASNNSQINIYNLLGQKMKTFELGSINSVNEDLDLSVLSKGVYLLELKNGKDKSISRLILE
ncbi:MAG: reprolysin-like metallopeptidase [Bacteroidia bacterium]